MFITRKTSLSIRLMYSFTGFVYIIICLDGNKIEEQTTLSGTMILDDTFKQC